MLELLPEGPGLDELGDEAVDGEYRERIGSPAGTNAPSPRASRSKRYEPSYCVLSKTSRYSPSSTRSNSVGAKR